MKNVKKLVLLVALIAATAAASVAGTLAYLTDRDSEANVFTVGDVQIDLNEDFDQGAQLIPGVDIEKKPTITNTGKNNAWVWAEIAIPEALDNDDDASLNVVHFNYSKKSVEPGLWNWQNEGKWRVSDKQINGVDYKVYTVLYGTILKPNETTAEPVMTKVYMDTHVDIDPNGQWNKVVDGVATRVDWNSEVNGNPVIYVSAYAMQTEGFDNVEEAYAAYQAQWGDNGSEYGEVPALVSVADEMIEALENGENVVLTGNIKIDPASMSNAYGKTGINVKNGQTIDGAGYTVDIKGAGGTWDSGINTTGGLIKNLTVTGSFRGIFINHNSDHSEPVILENVTIDGTTYTISCDQGKNQGLEAYGSTFNGWTSFAATLGNAKFVKCNFGEGNGYSYMRPYAPTEFVNCEFEAGFEMDARAAVTFENCTIGGQPLTADNLATLVTSNNANATVK